MLDLPADIYHLVCEILAKKQDFGSLFNCALSNKLLCGPALMWLYRIHNQSAVISSEGNDAELARNHKPAFQDREAAQRQTVANWALQWKSITRSSLGLTAQPYCLWIRSLDLRNLQELLDDVRFRDAAMDNFFADEMARFSKDHGTPMKQRIRGAKHTYKRIDVPYVLQSIGESITSFASKSALESQSTAAMEDLSGNIGSAVLPLWVGRLSNLKSMTLWDGSNLNADVAISIANKCYKFNDLTIYSCLRDDADKDLATFFNSLRPDTLGSFTVLRATAIGPQTLLSLTHHSKSLKTLKLDGLKSDAIRKLSHLQSCHALECLEISDADRAVNLEATENDIYLEVVAWLLECKTLRELTFGNLVSGPAIVTQVCLSKKVKLQKLTVLGYPMTGNSKFHVALSGHNSLEQLELRADPEDTSRDDLDILISSLASLTKLKYLNLLSTSEYCRTEHILALTAQLSSLEELSFMGYHMTDDLWHGIAHLHQLRSLNIHAITTFTADGILAYISTLKDTNRGLLLSVMAQDEQSPIKDAQLAEIREQLAAKVDGKFEMTLWRDNDSEDYSD